jgi:hypothetical protein
VRIVVKGKKRDDVTERREALRRPRLFSRRGRDKFETIPRTPNRAELTKEQMVQIMSHGITSLVNRNK